MSGSAWGYAWGETECLPTCIPGLEPYTCGTGLIPGGNTGIMPIIPGDPGPFYGLTAEATIGGIQLRWAYPAINAHAVAHTVVYRSTTSSFATATPYAFVSANRFFDALDVELPTTYYYWIEGVSISGNKGAVIGPATATVQPLGDDYLERLTAMIDEGVLAQSLKQDIGKITTFGNNLLQEIQDRIASEDALGALIQQAQDEVNSAYTFLQSETTQRLSADDALLQQMNLMAVQVNDNSALIFNESQTRANEDEALATQMNYLYAESQSNLQSAVQTEATARANADTALANQITTTQTTLNNNIASVQQNLQTNINTVNGKVVDIGALWTAKVSVNGLVGGFGVYNDGNTVQAGFDVDTFWIGRTNADKVKPFIVHNGTVFIDKARIRNADIDTLKIAGESVTVPRVYSLANTGRLPSSWTTLGAVSQDCGGGGAIIIVSCNVYSDDRPGEIRILVNGSQVHLQSVAGRVGGGDLTAWFSVCTMHALGGSNGVISVAVQARSVEADKAITCTNNRLLIMSGKR